MSSSLTRQLIELIDATEITAADRGRAALFVLDALANAVAGRNSDAGRVLCAWGAANHGDAARRALLLGGLTHILESDDLHRASVTHPGCVVVPAALAVGLRERCGGHELLDAVLQGYEAMCRVGASVGRAHYRFWHNTATCGPFGSAMAAARLTGLSAEQSVHALGNAGTQSAGLWEFVESGAMSKHLHAGRAAEAGIVAADLARLGFTGPPAVLEGRRGLFAATCPDARPEALLARAPTWQLLQTSIKPWPCCRHTHPAIDAAIELNARLGGRTIVSVDAEVYRAALDICDRPEPDSGYSARFSLQHCIAAALADGRIGFESFDAPARERLAVLRQRVRAEVAEPYASAYPDRYWGCALTVATADGDTLRVERQACKGDPEMPPEEGELIEKAVVLFRYGGFSDVQADRMVAATMRLPDGEADWQILSQVLPAGTH